MAIELMLLAVNMNFVAFSHYLGDMAGQVFVFFILTVAAAESAIGLAILVLLFRNRDTINVDELDSAEGLNASDDSNMLDTQRISCSPSRSRRWSARIVAGPVRQRGSAARRRTASPSSASLVVVRRCRSMTLQRRAWTAHASTATVYDLADGRRPEDGDRLPGRPPDRDDDVRRDLRVADGAHLHHRLHGRRPRLQRASSPTSRCSRSRC